MQKEKQLLFSYCEMKGDILSLFFSSLILPHAAELFPLRRRRSAFATVSLRAPS